MFRVVIFILFTLAIIGLDWYRHHNLKKSLIALATFVWICSLAMVGLTMRTVIPLFILHILFILFSYLGLLFYIYKERYIWWIFFLPLLTPMIFISLNYFDGSRYEN